jgi:hypothetical protein
VVTRKAQSLFEERRADVVFIIPAGMTLHAAEQFRGSGIAQQPNNMNAIVAELAVLTAINVSAVLAAQNAVKHWPSTCFGCRKTGYRSSPETAQSINRRANV